MSRPTAVIAHRGASGYRPEHTAAAYRLAFALGADAIEPDLVPSRDGVLVVRHESEISGTTDVASRPEFASRRTTKEVEGRPVTGWFTEDFDWAELATLHARERLPKLRQHGTRFDGMLPLLRLEDVVRLLDDEEAHAGRRPVLVAELKHPTHFAALGYPVAELLSAALAPRASRDDVVVECFEESALHAVRAAGVEARFLYLIEEDGAAPDLVARIGAAAPSYSSQLTGDGLRAIAERVDGVSLPKSRVLTAARGSVRSSGVVERARAEGLEVYVWTLRAENRFLLPEHRGDGRKGDHGDWMREFRAILDTGVHGVFADQPDLALAARDGIR